MTAPDEELTPVSRRLIVTIDGPAGTGKSTIARGLAQRLGVEFLDTGAMYRATALLALQAGVSLDNEAGVADLLRQSCLRFDWAQDPPAILIHDGVDVTQRVREADVTAAVSSVAGMPQVRAALVEQQQRIARDHPRLVTEGRDQGTVVFPNATVKFYLDASAEVRAQRRLDQICAGGGSGDFETIRRDILRRDEADRSRAVGPLLVADDAILVDTSELSIEQVIETLVNHFRRALAVKQDG